MPATLAAARRIVTPGIDRLLGPDRGLVEGRRVGVVSNPASVDAGFRHTADRLVEDPGVTVAAIFGPQHGFRSDLQDNMIETPHASDARRRVPIFSLYSETREPTAEMLRDLDVLVVDLQDVGTRVYTYIYTMANCMRAAARHGVHVVVCDRPNPIGGEAVEGSILQPSCTSFVGQFP
ncbi:MAG: exo-beta-N-acetylmuramidase NamZ domain-containing protein, partial [Acidobacteriota bacterium]